MHLRVLYLWCSYLHWFWLHHGSGMNLRCKSRTPCSWNFYIIQAINMTYNFFPAIFCFIFKIIYYFLISFCAYINYEVKFIKLHIGQTQLSHGHLMSRNHQQSTCTSATCGNHTLTIKHWLLWRVPWMEGHQKK